FRIKHTNAGDVVGELQVVISIFAGERRYRTDFLDQLHRPLDLAVGENGVALNIDLLDLDLGPLVDIERHSNGIRRNQFGRSFNRCVLPSLLGEHQLDYGFGFLYARGVVRRLLTKSDFFLAQLLQNFGIRNGLVAFVRDAPYQRLFLDPEHHDLARLAFFLGHLDVIEELQGIQRLNIATDHVHIETIADLRLKVVCDRAGRYPSIV